LHSKLLKRENNKTLVAIVMAH